MKKIKTYVIKLSLLIIMVLVAGSTLTGCWSAHEIDDLAIVNIMGIDQTETGELKVTTVIVKPTELFSEAPAGGGNPIHSPFLIQTVTGDSMFEIMGKLSNSVSEKMYLGHLNVVVFDEDIARNKMRDCLDYFKRGNEFRPNIKLLVTRDSAEKIVRQRPNLNSTLGIEIQDLVESRRFGTTKMVADISQFTEKMDDQIEDPITGVISADDSNDDVNTKKEVETQGKVKTKDNLSDDSVDSKEHDSNSLNLNGTAVFKRGHLAGFLNDQQTEGLLLLKGNLDSGIVTLNCGKNDQGTVGLQIADSESTYTPSISQGKPRMDITLSVDADIGDYTCGQTTLSTEKITALDRQLKKKIQNRVEDVLNLTQKQWQTDILGFGKAFYHKNPDQWKQLEPNWRNGLLKQMDVDVTITANIRRYGLTKESIKPNE